MSLCLKDGGIVPVIIWPKQKKAGASTCTRDISQPSKGKTKAILKKQGMQERSVWAWTFLRHIGLENRIVNPGLVFGVGNRPERNNCKSRPSI